MNRDECLKIVAEAQSKGLRANLSNADLSDADLSDADLSNTNLSYANLIGAKLTNANLTNANLSNADLTNANLTGANLSGADLTNAYLTNANLDGANLVRANLDFASWPFWCGGTNVKLDDRGACELAYFAYNQDYQDPASLAAIEPIRPMAQKFIDVYRQDAPALRAPWVG